MHKLDRWTLTASIGLVIVALMACKKKEEETPPATSASAAPEPTPSAAAADDAAPSTDVTRYGDKETTESGTVRVTYANAKVFKEADDSGTQLTTLSLGTLVNRKARYGNWMLIDYPSGPGELSPGWILSKYLDDRILTITLDASVKTPDAAVATVDAAAPVVDAAAPAPTRRTSIPIDQIKKAIDAKKNQK